jgi:uncharacterized protein YndB with AHSA1/START domain
MNKFTDTAGALHRLSLAAMEEASRYGQRTADIDHMLLALTLDDQMAGQSLRSLGITLASARDAVEKHHAAQIASLGIVANAAEPGPIVFHQTGGYEWSDRALTVIKRASERGERGDAEAVLRKLVEEPSGLIRALLHRLGSSPDAVLACLDEAERIPAPSSDLVSGEALSGTTEVFVPASVGEVWALLADPARMPEWDQALGSVDVSALPSDPRPGDHWEGRSRTSRPDGKPLNVRPELLRQRIELRALVPGALIEWRITYPDAQRANARNIRIELTSAAGGAQLLIKFRWERHAGRRPRPVLRSFMRPLIRIVIRMQISQLGAGISRVFR